jgi:DNA invertase Pin-like site-specific DNA recombinase
MIYGYARVSTDGQSVEAQVRQLAKAGCAKVFREVASGAKADRTQLRKALDRLEAGDGHCQLGGLQGMRHRAAVQR